MVTKYVKHEISWALLLLPIKKVHNIFFQYDVNFGYNDFIRIVCIVIWKVRKDNASLQLTRK